MNLWEGQVPTCLTLNRLLSWLSLACLLTGRAAGAQSPPSVREGQDRRTAVSSNPDAPVPEVRVAANTRTLFHFDALIDRASVEVEGRTTRFRLVDVGDSTLILEPSVEPGSG